MKEEKRYKIFYEDKEDSYIIRYLTDDQILDGYLSEAAAFKIFYADMIMCNSYIQNNFDNIDELISAYDEEDDYYIDEFQVFIINPEYDEDLTIKVTKLMHNTLYYDYKNDIYLTGITDLGTSRNIVPTDIKVMEDK